MAKFSMAKPDDQSNFHKKASPFNNSLYTNAIMSIALNLAAETAVEQRVSWSRDD